MQLIKKILAPFEKFLVFEFLQLATKYFVNQNKSYNYSRFFHIIKSSIRLVINKLKIIRKDNSFANEMESINNIINKIGEHNRYLVDIGASDGITQSSSVKLLVNFNYSGSLFEHNSESFSKLAFLYNSRSDIALVKSKITPDHVVKLFEGLAIPKTFSFLNIDIDSYDLEIIRRLIKHGGFMPKVISMEINEIFPPNIEFEVLYSDNHSWQGDHFFGCSIASANKTLNELGYSLIAVEYNNAFFVNNSLKNEFDLSLSIFELYEQGYKNKYDRNLKFPGNLDVEFLLSCSAQYAELKINTLFQKYEGKFLLKVSD